MTDLSISTAPRQSIFKRGRRYFRELWQRREFAYYLALGNLKARNASTTLGIAWWVLNPLLLASVYLLVFGVLLGSRRPDDFLAYLLAGIFPFYYTSSAMTGSVNALLANSKLIVNLKFPKLILPLSSVFESLVGFVASLIVFFPIIWIGGALSGAPNLLLLVAVTAFHTLFNMGIGSLVARLAVPFRDLNNLIPYLTRLWLYTTPIIWPLSMLDDAPSFLAMAVRLNPLTAFVGLYRAALISYDVVRADIWFALGWALVLGICGVAVFIRQEGHMTRYL